MKFNKSAKELKEKLTPLAYQVTRHGETEPPFSGELYNNISPGVYCCVCCDAKLFTSTDKYDSGTGWPSFKDAFRHENIKQIRDHSHNMIRTEVRCSYCDSHLGHLFNDGPPPTNKRYCINSVSLSFKAE